MPPGCFLFILALAVTAKDEQSDNQGEPDQAKHDPERNLGARGQATRLVLLRAGGCGRMSRADRARRRGFRHHTRQA